VFPGGYNYRSVEVNGTEYTDVAVPLIYMAAGLHIASLHTCTCRYTHKTGLDSFIE
jgi:hypothetical protein